MATRRCHHLRGDLSPCPRIPASLPGKNMLGNVWEWVQDWDGKYPAGPVTDPKGPETGTYRMRRGCGWNNEANVCRVANRYSVIGYRDDFLGFRVVRITP